VAANYLAGVALRKGRSVARKHIDKRLAAHNLSTADIAKIVGRRESFGTRLAAAVLVRLATRSVPGALAVGGGIVAKALLERRRRRRAAAADDAGK
jgi:hypothetical protein